MCLIIIFKILINILNCKGYGGYFFHNSHIMIKRDFTVYKSSDKYSKMIFDFTKGIDEQNSDINNKVIQFHANCYCYNAPGYLRDCVSSIPILKKL